MEKIVIMVLITLTMGQAKDDLEIMKEMMAEMKMEMAELASTKDDLAITKDELAITKARTDELEREVAILKATPYIHSCGFNPGLYATTGTIPYTSLLCASNNTEGGGLDITTGVFTAPHPGTYTVSWDLQAGLDSGEYVNIYLQKNGETLYGAGHFSRYNGPSGDIFDQGKLLPSSTPTSTSTTT